jgi:hypothetical protein
VRLSGRRRDVLEVRVVVKDDCAVMLGHGGSEKIDDSGGSVVAARGHADLNVTRTFSDSFADGQHDIQRTAALSDGSHIGEITT